MKKVISLIMLVVCFNANAQVNNDVNGRRYIEVTGVNEIEITPDEIYITIILRESKERASIQKQENELKQSIKELGIDLANLTLNSANAGYGRLKILKKDVQVSKSYQLKISTAETLARVYERLEKIDADGAFISRVEHSKIQEFKKTSRVKALVAAKEKVDYLLVAIGQQAGQPIQITEVENYINNYIANNAAMYRKGKAAYEEVIDDENDELSFKKIKIKTSFLVRYEIANK